MSVPALNAKPETAERRARRLFDEMARNIGRETVNYMKLMYPATFVGQPTTAEISMVNHIRNDINYRMRPLLMAMIAMHKEWEAELEPNPPQDDAREGEGAAGSEVRATTNLPPALLKGEPE